MLGADTVIFAADRLNERRLLPGADEAADHRHRAAGIEDMNHRLRIARRNLHRGVRLARGRAPDEQRHLESFALHFFRHAGHFVQRRRDEAAQADDVHLLLARGLENFLARHHDAEVDDFIVVAAEHDADDVFADVVHVAFDRGHQDFARVQVGAAGGFFLRLHEREQVGHRLLHHAGRLHDLRQKHLAGAEQIADNVHAVHERAFDHGQWLAVFPARLFDILLDVVHNALHQRVAEPLFDAALAPFVLHHFGLVLLLH